MIEREDDFMDNLAFNHYSFVNYRYNGRFSLLRKITIIIHLCSCKDFFMFYEIKLCLSNWYCAVSFFSGRWRRV